MKYTRALSMVVKWRAVREARGYGVQVGDPAGETWGPEIVTTKSTYAPEGLAPGKQVAIRVAAHRPSGMSEWSDPITVTVR